MSTNSPYEEALQFIRQNPGTSGSSGLAKLVVSLYNEICGFSFAECVRSLDPHLTNVALRMVADYAKHGETPDLRAAGKIIVDDLYPRLWETGKALNEARTELRKKWEAEERKEELDALRAAEAKLFTNPAKLIPANTAKELLDQGDPLYAYTYSDFLCDWKNEHYTRDTIHAAIDMMGGAELSNNCPEGSSMLAVRIDKRIFYVTTDLDARDAYLESQNKA